MPQKPYKKLRLIEGHESIIQQYIHEELGELQFAHSGMVNVSLPYRSQGSEFSRRSGPYSLNLTTRHPVGLRASSEGFLGAPEALEVPFGVLPRIILLALQTKAIQSQSPDVNVQPSFSAFARDLGLNTDGKTIKKLRAQMLNLALTSIELEYFGKEKLSIYRGPIFSELHSNLQTNPNQSVLWPDQVRFSYDYFHSLQQHSVPLKLDAIRALQNSPRNLDLYQFLAYRLHSLKRPIVIPWSALQNQFSDGRGSIDAFRKGMRRSIKDVLVLYPEAKIGSVRGGIKLYRSNPPVLKKYY